MLFSSRSCQQPPKLRAWVWSVSVSVNSCPASVRLSPQHGVNRMEGEEGSKVL